MIGTDQDTHNMGNDKAHKPDDAARGHDHARDKGYRDNGQPFRDQPVIGAGAAV